MKRAWLILRLIYWQIRLELLRARNRRLRAVVSGLEERFGGGT